MYGKKIFFFFSKERTQHLSLTAALAHPYSRRQAPRPAVSVTHGRCFPAPPGCSRLPARTFPPSLQYHVCAWQPTRQEEKQCPKRLPGSCAHFQTALKQRNPLLQSLTWQPRPYTSPALSSPLCHPGSQVSGAGAGGVCRAQLKALDGLKPLPLFTDGK